MKLFERLIRSKPTAEKAPLRHLRTGILSLYGFAFLVVAVGMVWNIWNDYQRTLQDAEQQSLSLARMLDEHLTRSLVSVDQAMQNIGEDIERAGGIDEVDERAIHERLKDKVQFTPQIRAIIAISSKGILRSHGLEYPTRQVDLSDRDYFIYHRDTKNSASRIGEPIISRTDYKWLLPLTKRLSHRDGSFSGVMLAGIEPNYYLHFYETLRLDDGIRIQLVRNDGTVLLTYPHDANLLGRNIRSADPSTFDALLKKESAYFTSTDNRGAESYVVQLNNQSKLPVFIRINADRTHLLTKFKDNIIAKVAIAVLLILVTSILLYILLRQINRVEASESQLYLTQFTVDESPDMIFWCDETGRIRYNNRCLSQTSGYSHKDLLDLQYTDLLLDPDGIWAQMQHHMLMLTEQITLESRTIQLPTQDKQNIETQLRLHNGQFMPVESTLSLIEFYGQPYLCVNARDITARLAAEQELRLHRDHLQDLVQERTAEIRTVLDASPLAITMLMSDKIHLVNPAFTSLFGYESEEIMGQTYRLIFEDETRFKTAKHAISTQISKGGVYRGEIELRQRNNTSFWAMLFAKALFPDDPERGMILIIEDITAQRISAQAVRSSERLKRSILNTTSDAFALIDTQRIIIDANSALCDLLNTKRQNIIGQTPEAIWGDLGSQLFPHYQQADIEPHSCEIILPTHDEELRPFLTNSGVIPNEQGDIEYTFVFLTDISEQKKIEHSLLEAKEVAEAANKAKSVFLTNMSHELRTPMHAIMSFSEMGTVKAGQATPEQILRYFERIHTSGKRLLTLLNDLLDMSRLDAHKMTYEKFSHTLQHTVRNAVSELSSLLARKNVEVIYHDTAEKIYAVYDKARITQVIINLLSNAIKFSPNGSHIEITFIENAVLSNGQAAVGLTIRDEGQGIHEDDLEKIFETFAQSTHNHAADGTGLGLAISRQIINDHGGNIMASNHANGGAVFTLLLPIHSADEAS